MEYSDQQIACMDCSASFVFSAGEQEFYAKKGFSSPPKRCKDCRNVRKRDRGSAGGNGVYRSTSFDGQDDYRAPSFGGSGSSRGSNVREMSGLGASPRVARPMYDIVCGECGKASRVPFRPSQDKPVYCHDCYRLKRG